MSETSGITEPGTRFTYDHNGNRLTQSYNGAAAQSFSYNSHDVLLSGTDGTETDTWDPNGNETGYTIYGRVYQYTWDDEDRLTSATDPGFSDTLTYNGLGLRVGKTDSTGTYTYACDGTSPGSPVLSDGHAIYTPGQSETRGGVSSYDSFDRLGNLWTVNGTGAGQTYYQDNSGFGGFISGSGTDPSPFQFGGGNGCLTDVDTGLVLMGHRYYDTRIGRFISQDPAGDGDNWYAYAGNSPTNEVDPSGLTPLWPGQPDTTGEIPGFNGTPTGYFSDGSPYFVPNGGPETGATPEDPSSYVYDLNSFGYTGPNGPSSEGEGLVSGGSVGMFNQPYSASETSFDNRVTGGMDAFSFGTFSKFGKTGSAGAFGLFGVAMASNAFGAGEAKAADYLTVDLIKEARDIPIKQGEGLARDYGGKASNWLKKSTKVFQHPDTGEDVEIHWFQNTRDNIGKILIKWKFNPYE